METTVLHGPDRTPLHGSPDGLRSVDDAIPFHGIVSRGLREWLDRRPDGPELWERHAHRLHDGTDAGGDAELVELRAAAQRHGVLSLTESAAAAERCVERHLATAEAAAVATCELWNLKEGHTSSVWAVTLGPDPDQPGRRFALNVARDTAAGEELRDTSRRLRELAARDAALPIALVLDVTTLELEHPDGARDVTVTRNELVSDALEVHRMPDGSARYALVERFVTHPEAPARIRAIRGRAASPEEQAAIDAAVEQVRAAAGPDLPVNLEIDDGDVVWNGREAIVVAIG